MEDVTTLLVGSVILRFAIRYLMNAVGIESRLGWALALVVGAVVFGAYGVVTGDTASLSAFLEGAETGAEVGGGAILFNVASQVADNGKKEG